MRLSLQGPLADPKGGSCLWGHAGSQREEAEGRRARGLRVSSPSPHPAIWPLLQPPEPNRLSCLPSLGLEAHGWGQRVSPVALLVPCRQELCILVLDATQTTQLPVCRVPDSGRWAWGWRAGGTAHVAAHLWARCEGHASLLPALGRPARWVLGGEAVHTLASHSHGSG